MVVKNRPASSGEADMIPGSGRAPGGGHDNSHQQSYRENPLDKGACQTKVYWITESDMTEATEHTQYVNIASVCVYFIFYNKWNFNSYRGIVLYFIWLITF